MRTQPGLHVFIRVIVAAALLTGAVTDALAQEAGKKKPDAAVPSQVYDLEIKEGILIWTGAKRQDNAVGVQATLGQVIDLLRELHPEANFVLSPVLQEVIVADLKMRTSSVEEKLEAIRIASGSQFVWRAASPAATTIDPSTGLRATQKNTPPLYVLEAHPAPAKPGLQVEAFNIGLYLESLSGNENKEERQKLYLTQIDQIERMVVQTVQEYESMSASANKARAKSISTPSIRFHPGANLAIIIGEPEAVAVAAKVIGALPGAQRSVASEAFGQGPPSPKLDEALKGFQRKLPPSRQ